MLFGVILTTPCNPIEKGSIPGYLLLKLQAENGHRNYRIILPICELANLVIFGHSLLNFCFVCISFMWINVSTSRHVFTASIKLLYMFLFDFGNVYHLIYLPPLINISVFTFLSRVPSVDFLGTTTLNSRLLHFKGTYQISHMCSYKKRLP